MPERVDTRTRGEEILEGLDWLGLSMRQRKASGPVVPITPLSTEEREAIEAALDALEKGIDVRGSLSSDFVAEDRLQSPGQRRDWRLVDIDTDEELIAVLARSRDALHSFRIRKRFLAVLQRLPQPKHRATHIGPRDAEERARRMFRALERPHKRSLDPRDIKVARAVAEARGRGLSEKAAVAAISRKHGESPAMVRKRVSRQRRFFGFRRAASAPRPRKK